MRIGTLRSLIFLLSLLLLQGCSQSISGDVFVLNNKDGTARKLPLVDVYAVPFSKLANFESLSNAKRDAEKKEVLIKLDSLDLKSLFQEHTAIKKGEVDILIHQIDMGSDFHPSVTAMRSKQYKKIEDLNKKLTNKFKELDVESLNTKVKNLNPIEFYAHEIKNFLTEVPTQKTVTDSEGRFNLTLPSEETVLVAISKDNNGETSHLWLVRLVHGEKKVTLSDANSFEKGCATCLLRGIDKTLVRGEGLPGLLYSIASYIKVTAYGLSSFRELIFSYAERAKLI